MSLARAGLIPTLSWIRVKDIISSGDLHLLGRSQDQQIHYDDFSDRLKYEWQSVRDYILVTKFGYYQTVSQIGKKCGKYHCVVIDLVHFSVIDLIIFLHPVAFESGTASTIDEENILAERSTSTVFVENDFPYNFDRGT